ncbi:winged helix-turn-helix domain-containing protein [Halomicroarcula sp. S1AR25-4]|uniref:winged helix-turn-helix domain-containing protein n=1 Tax=Haloarcula sp. S1AR25-4 TaxID=2950538 RepID=UPI0028750F18|nr:winged helix-turn-helix domain-containing protein [Halomicroarcula sp. S1AR25-4]MDS0280257.1 winged helix-turn-helix domain-containing protein [Halomicroarcula sp. S1AR25-4]
MDTGDANPFAEQQRLFELLSQDTRQLIVQELLGHPAHLMSLAELEYMTGKNRATIKNHLDTLRDEDIIVQYIFEPNKETRGLPAQFYGFTERGVEILHDYKYLRGIPVARALYENTRKTEKIQRHEAAPRPDLPPAVAKALEFDEPDLDIDDVDVSTGR